jgi:peptidoglycan hydrolase-like protein with peptidoglycan-binding domain
MTSRFIILAIVLAAAIPMALCGCKGKTQPATEEVVVETMATESVPQPDAMLAPQAQTAVAEPSASVAKETIPPTAALGQAPKALPAAAVPVPDRGKDIQTALKNSGFYTGAIDGKIGPKTKSAIMEFQKAKGLKPDGRVGPKTWAELEKYLLRQ